MLPRVVMAAFFLLVVGRSALFSQSAFVSMTKITSLSNGLSNTLWEQRKRARGCHAIALTSSDRLPTMVVIWNGALTFSSTTTNHYTIFPCTALSETHWLGLVDHHPHHHTYTNSFASYTTI